MEYNAGEIVELAIRRREISITELSRRLQVNRRTLYNWFTKKDLHPSLVIQIGRAIDYDFVQDFHSGFFGSYHQPVLSADPGDIPKIEEDVVVYWMKKYTSLLEEYKVLLRKGSSPKTSTLARIDM